MSKILMPMSSMRSLGIIFALAVLALAPLSAQTTTGTITGTVVDPSNNVIPTAKVTVTNEATGDVRRAESTGSGDFSFPSLLPATYTLQVEMAGFQTYKSSGNVLTPNGRLSLGEIRLVVGSVAETIEVAAQAAQVATQSGENSALITRDQFSMIPTKGRDLTNMLRLLPGVQMTQDQEAFGGATGFGATMGAVQGTRSAQQNLTVDGIVANDLGAPAGLSGQLNMDAVQEVKVLLSNYQAEYGRNPGANISMTTRSGTKEFHGSAYYYFRNEALNANDFFRNKSIDPRVNSKPAVYRFNTMGVTLGGPVPEIPKINPGRDKLFFFYSFDNTVNRIPDASFTRLLVPTALERTGDFSQSATKPKDPTTGQAFPNNQIPSSRFSSMAPLLNLYPLANAATTSLGNYEYLRVQKIPNFQHVFRIDHRISSKDSLYVRGALWRKDTYGPGGTVGYGTNANWPFLESHYQYSDDSLAVNYTHIWTPTVISEFTAGARHSTELETKDDFDAVAKKGSRKGLGLTNLGYIFAGPNDNVFDLIPNISYGGVANAVGVGFGTRFGLAGYDTGFNVTHATTLILSRHTVKLGIYWNRALDMEARSGNVNGAFNFGVSTTNPVDSGNGFANQILGNFQTYTEANTRRPYLIFRHIIDWYAQDTWKVSRKLTLDYGLRFSHAPWFYQKNRNASIFDPKAYNRASAPRQYVPGLSNGVRVGVDPGTGQTVSAALITAFVPGTGSLTNGMVLQTDPGVPLGFLDSPGILVMPRVGFAYDPFGDGKMAIRGGAGIFYQTEDDGFFTGLRQTANPPYVYTAQVANSNISQLVPGSGFIFPAGVTGYDLTTGRPVTYNYSFGIQRDIGRGTIADVKYVGSLSRHQQGSRDLNTLPFGTRFLPQSIDPTTGRPLLDNALRPIPGYGSVTYLERNINSNYNSLQATLNRRFAKGFEFGIAYTYAKSLDYGSDERASAVPQFLSIRRNYGKSSYDQTHILVANWQYDLPGSKTKNLVGLVTRGWAISGVASFSSGIPLGISQVVAGGADLLGGGDPARVNLSCNPNLGHFDKTSARFFNTSCVAMPLKGDIGNAPKDAVRGPGRSNLDMVLFRNFNFTEKRVLAFRWEVYNTFNHTQFNAIDVQALNNAAGVNTSTTFGSATGAWPARQMQLSLRFTF